MKRFIEVELQYPAIPAYRFVPYSVPAWRGVTDWEAQCVDDANKYLKSLFSYQGFKEFFVGHHCCINEDMLSEYADGNGRDPAALRQEVIWNESIRGVSGLRTGSIRVDCAYYSGKYWFYDKRMIPRCEITLDGVCSFCLGDGHAGDYRVVEGSEYPELASALCYSSKWIIPYLYGKRGAFDVWRCTGVDVETDHPDVEKVIRYLIDEEVIINCVVRVDPSSYIWSNWASLDEGIDLYVFADLRSHLRRHSKEIKKLLQTC